MLRLSSSCIQELNYQTTKYCANVNILRVIYVGRQSIIKNVVGLHAHFPFICVRVCVCRLLVIEIRQKFICQRNLMDLCDLRFSQFYSIDRRMQSQKIHFSQAFCSVSQFFFSFCFCFNGIFLKSKSTQTDIKCEKVPLEQ